MLTYPKSHVNQQDLEALRAISDQMLGIQVCNSLEKGLEMESRSEQPKVPRASAAADTIVKASFVLQAHGIYMRER